MFKVAGSMVEAWFLVPKDRWKPQGIVWVRSSVNFCTTDGAARQDGWKKESSKVIG